MSSLSDPFGGRPTPPVPFPPDGDPARRWTRQVSQIRTRALRLKLEGTAAGAYREVLDEALELNASLLQELAGAHLQIQQVTAEKQEALDGWDYLFDHMLTACLVTDVHGTVLNANRAAALLLNLSAKSLKDRLLLHFVLERDSFQEVLASMRVEAAPVHTQLTVRPRERASVRTRVFVLPRNPGDLGTWLWFIAPEPGDSRQERGGAGDAHALREEADPSS